ncbi:MAG: hypothetical protein K5873_00810 [Treponema sp.]|nr:hypothetical protein [Treponema sp.]
MNRPLKRFFSSKFYFLALLLIFFLNFPLTADSSFNEERFYQSWLDFIANPQDYQAMEAFSEELDNYKKSDLYSIEFDEKKSAAGEIIQRIEEHAENFFRGRREGKEAVWNDELSALNKSMNELFIYTMENNKRYVLPFVQLLTILSVLTLVSAFALAIYLKNKRKIDYLTEKYHREQIVTQTIAEVQENERTRISRDLHDTITQDIRAELLLVHKLERSENLSEADSSLLKRIRTIDETNLLTIRNIIRNLTPPEIENADLISLISDFASHSQEISGMEIKFYAEKSQAFKNLSALEKLHIFRIIQEAVNNSIKHSMASEVGIFARENRNSDNKCTGLVFLISDDGKGMSINEKTEKPENDILENSTHLGIRGMESRAEILGAQLSIKSSEETGTQIKVTLPLRK